MSRSTRRNKKWLILQVVGRLEDYYDDGGFMAWRYPDLSPEQRHERHLARFTHKAKRGRFGVPRDFRRLHGSKAIRCRETQAIHRHLRQDDWENHLPESRARDAAWYWW